ncbi:MAG: acetoacetate decarboxylase family protein [Gammaproteobacteria bacterium]|nr:acetoacetate decarboxylase family protein [Gammaproteobacteria bacterium]
MGIPKRIRNLTGNYSLVDGIPFQLPVACAPSPVIMAGFSIDANRAKQLLPNEIHPLRLWNGRGVLLVTVINYLQTNIGKYIEYSIAIACTHGAKPAMPMLPALLMKPFGTGQYVLDLPVSTDVSVKGGKGIWGMPKHRAPLDFHVGENILSSQYDLDDKLVTYLEVERPTGRALPLNVGAANYCSFRGMLMKSYIYFKGNVHFCMGKNAKARFVVGEHERSGPLRYLDIDDKPLMTAFIPNAVGTLDDHMECWFLHDEEEIIYQPEGFESVINLGRDEIWPPAPTAPIRSWDQASETSDKERSWPQTETEV